MYAPAPTATPASRRRSCGRRCWRCPRLGVEALRLRADHRPCRGRRRVPRRAPRTCPPACCSRCRSSRSSCGGSGRPRARSPAPPRACSRSGTPCGARGPRAYAVGWRVSRRAGARPHGSRDVGAGSAAPRARLVAGRARVEPPAEATSAPQAGSGRLTRYWTAPARPPNRVGGPPRTASPGALPPQRLQRPPDARAARCPAAPAPAQAHEVGAPSQWARPEAAAVARGRLAVLGGGELEVHGPCLAGAATARARTQTSAAAAEASSFTYNRCGRAVRRVR